MPAWWALKVLPWLKAHWKDVGLGLGLIFFVLWLRAAGALSECQSARQTASVDLTAKSQALTDCEAKLTSTAKAHGSVNIAPGKPAPCPPGGQCPPCPEIHVDFGAEAGSGGRTGAASGASSTATAALKPSACPALPKWSLGIGAGASGGDNPRVHGLVSLERGNIGAYGLMDQDQAWAAGVKYTPLRWNWP